MKDERDRAAEGGVADALEQPVQRRDFLKVLGVGGAAAVAVGCSTNQVEKLIPYVASADDTVPGVSTYYATTCRECAVGCGIIVETRDGRAIKIEGNPAHPVNKGALCARGQSALQGLYNPDRYQTPMKRQGNALVATTWDDAISTLSTKLAAARKDATAKSAVFINQHEQGSFPAFLDQWLAGFGMPAHISYDAEAPVSTVAANRAAYGVSWPGYDFSAARLIVSFSADFLDGWGLSVPQQLAFADARARLDGGPRIVYIGPRRSLTGLNADTWIPARPGSLRQLAEAVSAAATGKGSGGIAAAAEAAGVSAASIESLVAELKAVRPSLLLAGGQDADATLLATTVNDLNKALGNVGQTIRPADGSLAFDGVASHAALREAADRMASGAVSIAFVRGANPAHTAPSGVRFAEAFAKVPFKVSFSSYPDETSSLCDLVLPDSHPLESWGDAEPVKGLLSLQQPVMDPVFSTRATADVLIAVAKQDPQLGSRLPANYRAYVVSRVGGASALNAALPTAMTHGSAVAPPAPKIVAARAEAAGQGEYLLHVYNSPVVGDGRGANKPWLQELPDPVTKIAWQTVIELHPETARKLSLEQGDHVTVTTQTGSITAPVYLYIGIRPDTIGVATGRGHSAYGRYAAGCGVNAMSLLGVSEDVRSGQASLTGARASIAKATGSSRIVTTEGSARQHDRGIAQAVTVEQFRAGETGEEEHHHFVGQASTAFLPGLRAPVAADAQGDLADPKSAQKGQYDPNHWSGVAKRRWAMVVDLSRCTGCSACVTACYAENNIPTVGAPWQGPRLWPDRTGFGANVTRDREMAWIRLERYFEIDREPKDVEFNPGFDTRVIPMMCQHCGNAPCESVCPVYATYHSPDGLNVQVYNRCVGTRYCSNGCPYKVRYYNWFGYGEPNRTQYAFPEPLNWQLNPDVTVRGKGVMEKCTFCVQRIREAENRARLEGREVKPDEFTVACAQACPSRAITFGDAADEEWAVARMIDDKRSYHVFEELNTFTAVVYLRKVNHPAEAH